MIRGVGGLLGLTLCAGLGCEAPASNGVNMPPKAAPAVTVVIGSGLSPAQAALLAAYPEHLARFDGNYLVWKDSTRMVWDDGRAKSGEALLDDPDLEDMFAQAYPRDSVVFLPDYDPGRCRPNAFFMKLYGGNAEEVRRRLVTVDWFGQQLQFNGEAGAAAALTRVAKRLAGSPALLPYLKPSAGTYNWRLVAGTQRLSNHSFGIAIDLHVAHAHYWRWSKEFKAGKPLVYQNKIPKEIVAAFEAEGFIWGGKWYHYDTMHFEYRPELLK
jgi:peptidoglycan LD-endopeptidase CwlK